MFDCHCYGRIWMLHVIMTKNMSSLYHVALSMFCQLGSWENEVFLV